MTNKIPSLQLTGAPGTYEIQAASNFSNWFPIRTVNTPTGTATLADSSATNAPARFYRTAQ
ncbi:MAG: hypothetical protein EXS35_04270 [Pedosphaera sp.]|nr:hypothetical protein [Pedosphaera sp.]